MSHNIILRNIYISIGEHIFFNPLFSILGLLLKYIFDIYFQQQACQPRVSID